MNENIASKANNPLEQKIMHLLHEICQYHESKPKRTAKSNKNNKHLLHKKIYVRFKKQNLITKSK